jgi:hypothetical protein
MSIRSFIQPGAFEPEAIAVMSEAFETAIKELQDTGDVMREVIAGRIIAAAFSLSPEILSAGVRNPWCGRPRPADCQRSPTQTEKL